MTPRTEEITERFTEWLDRYSPPRGMANAPKAMQQEADALLNCFLKTAPTAGYSQWVVEKLVALSESMTTRAWPTVGEVAKVLKVRGKKSIDNEAAVEENAVDILAKWYGKFGNQMPSMGRDSRTAALIKRGVLADEREARFRGFDLPKDQSAKAMKGPSGRDEWKHHVTVIARLRDIGYDEADAQERQRVPKTAPGNPVRRMQVTDWVE